MSWSLMKHHPTTHDLFGDLFRDWGLLSDRLFDTPSTRFPALNVHEGPENVTITAEVPGVKSEDIDVTVEGDTVGLTVEFRPLEPAEGEKLHRRERVAGKFSRSVQLPYPVDAESVAAEYRDGVLEIRVVRAPESRPRQIEIQSA